MLLHKLNPDFSTPKLKLALPKLYNKLLFRNSCFMVGLTALCPTSDPYTTSPFSPNVNNLCKVHVCTNICLFVCFYLFIFIFCESVKILLKEQSQYTRTTKNPQDPKNRKSRGNACTSQFSAVPNIRMTNPGTSG